MVMNSNFMLGPRAEIKRTSTEHYEWLDFNNDFVVISVAIRNTDVSLARALKDVADQILENVRKQLLREAMCVVEGGKEEL